MFWWSEEVCAPPDMLEKSGKKLNRNKAIAAHVQEIDFVKADGQVAKYSTEPTADQVIFFYDDDAM